ncbi:MAG: hypothetical protein GY911_13380, partial [Actinomycetales bacterium]|nr:hypothetical protein [Actinomycetales bacterium]
MALLMSIRVPKLQHHKATDQARVSIRGRDFYLGRHGSMEANRKYARIVTAITAGWSGDGDPSKFTNRTNSPEARDAGAGVVLVELVEAYEAEQELTY